MEDVKLSSVQSYPPVTPPPSYRSSESPRCKNALIVAVAVLSTTVAFILIGGGFYLKSLNDKIETSHSTDNSKMFTIKFMEKGSLVHERIAVDPQAQTETFYGEQHGSIDKFTSVIDFKKGIEGFVIPRIAQCFIIPLDRQLFEEPDVMETQLTGKNNTLIDAKPPTTTYVRKLGPAIVDRSVLPDKLRTLCQDMPVYWLKLDNNTRNKRAVAHTASTCTVRPAGGHTVRTMLA